MMRHAAALCLEYLVIQTRLRVDAIAHRLVRVGGDAMGCCTGGCVGRAQAFSASVRLSDPWRTERPPGAGGERPPPLRRRRLDSIRNWLE